MLNTDDDNIEITSSLLSEYADSSRQILDNKSKDDEEDLSAVSFLQELRLALFEARYWAPICAIICFFVAFYVTTTPYQQQSLYKRQINSLDDLKLVRPMLVHSEIGKIKQNTMYAETGLVMPNNDRIDLQFFTTATDEGHFRLPDLFYRGVTFGITAENPFASNPGMTSAMLLEKLRTMSTRPTHIMPRVSRNKKTGWSESGYAVYFSREDLLQADMLSNEPGEPWKRVREEILRVARQFKQVTVYQWAPHAFGAEDADDPYLNWAVLQLVVPTRTGLSGIESSVTVWLAAVNGTAPVKPREYYRKSEVEGFEGGATWAPGPLSASPSRREEL